MENQTISTNQNLALTYKECNEYLKPEEWPTWVKHMHESVIRGERLGIAKMEHLDMLYSDLREQFMQPKMADSE